MISNKKQVIEEINTIISKVAGFPSSELEEEISLRDELLIDSLKQMEIVAKTEIHFGIALSEDNLAALNTLGDYYNLVLDSIPT